VSGLTIPEGRLLVAELLEHATQPAFVYTHTWRAGDYVMWDNRATLHRGKRYDLSARRDLRRTTTLERPGDRAAA
jgi:alpha-ketoglutarate-dependent 2,4-dichlorophenoxyacetate dioxygenase